MDDEALLNQKDLFTEYYQEALAIRAICDDLDFPGEYSPVFVDIHVRGVEHFRENEAVREHYQRVINMIDPDQFMTLHERIDELDDERLREALHKVCIGDVLYKLDEYLEETDQIVRFFASQMNNLRRMYADTEYCAQMLTLYTFFVQPRIGEYDNEKIQKAFHKGRLQDMIRRINNKADEQEA